VSRKAGSRQRAAGGDGKAGSRQRAAGGDGKAVSDQPSAGGGTRDAKLISAARKARDNARADYSRFKVGAALETADGTIVTGCNIENATYGLTLCAERVAMFKALSEGHRAFRRIAIVADTEDPTPPCGACRQILWEFGGDLEVILADLQTQVGSHRLSELLPLPFDARLLR
jgi:cytidine deaminase